MCLPDSTEKVLPKVRKLDDEIADLLEELVTEYTKADGQTKHPFNVEVWRKMLEDHPEGELKFAFIQQGADIAFKGSKKRLSRRIHNFVNSRRECIEILKRILKELKKGYIIPGKGFYQLNLLCVPKKHPKTGLMTEIRVARHGSYSTAKTISLNDGITEAARTMNLPGFYDYVKLTYGFKFAALRDLKDAFRQMLLALESSEYVQYCIFALHFQDRRVAYGVADAAARCQDLSMLIVWICHKKVPAFREKIHRMLVHIDDFIMVAMDRTECTEMSTQFDGLIHDLGVIASEEKSEDNMQRFIAHGGGFKLDLPYQTVFVPKRKAIDMCGGLTMAITCRYATGEALEALTGRMMHWTKMNRRAKSLCNRNIRRLHMHLRKLPKREKKYMIFHIDYDWCKALSLYLHFFVRIREVSMASLIYRPSITIVASSDACDDGAGFVIANKWYAYKFATTPNKFGTVHRNIHINMKEAHALLMLMHNMRATLTGRRVWLLCDNKVCVDCIYKSWSGSKLFIDWIQELSMVAMMYSIDFRIDYVRSRHNTFSDLLSRGKIHEFHRLTELYGFEMEELRDLDYYDHLRIMNGPIQMPKWLNDDDGLPDEIYGPHIELNVHEN